MATTQGYIEFVAERLAFVGNVRYKKMFGEYMVYINEKPLVLVCDETAFVKKLPCLDALMADAERGFPYNDAKEHYILDVENSELTKLVIEELDKVTPMPKPKVKKPPKPDVLYHFTSPIHLSAILQSGYLALSESNLNIGEGNCGVVWLTTSPDPINHGLKFDDAIFAEFDKTRIRITVRYKPSFKLWDEWSDKKGMDNAYKEIIIATAHAEETYKTWYISERKISFDDILKIENLATGEIFSIESTLKSLPAAEPFNMRFKAATDEYIINQRAELQVILLNVREVIRAALPNATEKISYQMPTFWQGRNLIHFAAQKNHLGIYPGAAAMEHFAPRLVEYKTSKGAIQFPYKTFGAEQMKLIAEIAAWCGRENIKV